MSEIDDKLVVTNLIKTIKGERKKVVKEVKKETIENLKLYYKDDCNLDTERTKGNRKEITNHKPKLATWRGYNNEKHSITIKHIVYKFNK